jgi:cyanophycinase
MPKVGVDDPIAPLPGTVMLAGTARLTEVSLRTFASLAGGKEGRLVIVVNGKVAPETDRWQRAMGEVTVLTLDSKKKAEAVSTKELMFEATGVWLLSDVTSIARGTAFQEGLNEVVLGGNAIGGQGAGAQSLGSWIATDEGPKQAFACVPQSIVRTEHLEENLPVAPEYADLVQWEIPPTGVMVLHGGRRVAVIGEAEITATVAAANGWPKRSETFGATIAQLPFTTDLVSWTRSAKSRNTQLFPPKNPPPVQVESGTLILIGGGGSTDDMWERFIEAAGGTDANFVCIPQSPDSFSARKLRERGCKNVTVLFGQGDLRSKAETDDEFLEPLKNADGIFFGGGRTYRFMDAYQNTTAHQLMHQTLQRGGVIAGTSAGAQIQGDFLVRGDPRTNQTIWYPGNDTGLAFLRGVIVDVHFAERGRENTLPDLLVQHPQMFGIGIDEATAIVVTGHQAEVLGRGSAWFYDTAGADDTDKLEPVVLDAGKRYDLKTRKAIP